MTKFYRNVTQIEMLSNEPWGDEAEDLEVVNYEISDGGSIGYVTRTVRNEELTQEQVIAADIRMGGDGTFLTSTLHIDEEEEDGDDEAAGRS